MDRMTYGYHMSDEEIWERLEFLNSKIKDGVVIIIDDEPSKKQIVEFTKTDSGFPKFSMTTSCNETLTTIGLSDKGGTWTIDFKRGVSVYDIFFEISYNHREKSLIVYDHNHIGYKIASKLRLNAEYKSTSADVSNAIDKLYSILLSEMKISLSNASCAFIESFNTETENLIKDILKDVLIDSKGATAVSRDRGIPINRARRIVAAISKALVENVEELPKLEPVFKLVEETTIVKG